MMSVNPTRKRRMGLSVGDFTGNVRKRFAGRRSMARGLNFHVQHVLAVAERQFGGKQHKDAAGCAIHPANEGRRFQETGGVTAGQNQR